MQTFFQLSVVYSSFEAKGDNSFALLAVVVKELELSFFLRSFYVNYKWIN